MLNLNQKTIKKILLQAEEYESSLRKKVNKKNNGAYYGVMALCYSLIALSLFSIGLGLVFKNQFILLAALIFLLLAEISLLLSTVIDMLKSRKSIVLFFRQPSKILLQNLEFSTRTKIQFSKKLINFELRDLEFTKREIMSEKDHFDKRTSIITGTIDKIGIFPTILATILLILTQMSNTNVQKFVDINPNFKFYFFAAIFLVFFFQIFSVKNFFTSLKLSKMIDILDYVIELKKETE
ncbi:hypothetical protein [Acinetobacter junii]|uniref:hypothetical protein n=1 Tax=Acinetobacter junii TaxID=40215 RepID=UPI0012501ACD|nr:hypothetical protein [Acinetobacter junii]